MNNKVLVGFLVLVVGVGIGWYVMQGNAPTGGVKNEPTNGEQLPSVQNTPSDSGYYPDGSGTGTAGEEKGGEGATGAIATSAVSYTDNGFSPSVITVKKGTMVTFTNASTRGMWVASGVHPTHQLLPGFDALKSVAKTGVYEYTFTKVGTWKFHNHLRPTDEGSVVVTE